MCGANLPPVFDSTVECEYCGTLQTIPSADNEKMLAKFVRANRMRMAGDFDAAAKVYESIVEDFPQEAEAFWGLVLCRYGIEYVDDPVSEKKIPTCHRTSYSSVLQDVDYLQALELADPFARKLYRQEAECIESLREDILAVSAKEKPYDIFISYKEEDRRGSRTLDSVLAQDLYKALTARGYRVFFARISMEDKLGQAYEPYIFSALNSAKIMLVVGTDYDHFSAVWVKNEWSRFLKLMQKDRTKHLIPCYKDIDPYDMPDEFNRLQAQDLGKIGAHQDLIHGIEKLIGTRTHDVPGRQADELVSSGIWNINRYDYQAARNIFLEVLANDPSNADACLGMMLCGSDEERNLYALQFRTLAGAEPSRIEQDLWDKLFNKTLMCYQELGLLNRVRKALMATDKTPDSKTILALYQKWPDDQMIHKLADDDSMNWLSRGLGFCDGKEDSAPEAYEKFQKALAYQIHRADAHLGLAVCCPTDERTGHLQHFRSHMPNQLTAFEIKALSGKYPDEFINCYQQLGLYERVSLATAHLQTALKSPTVHALLNSWPDDLQIRRLADNDTYLKLWKAFEYSWSYSQGYKAYGLFQEILKRDPNNADALLGLAANAGSQNREAYLVRFREHAGAAPSRIERELWQKLASTNDTYSARLYMNLLACYAASGQQQRILQALEGYKHPIESETLFQLLTDFPDIRLAEALVKTGSDLNVWKRLTPDGSAFGPERTSLFCAFLRAAKAKGKDLSSIAAFMLAHFPDALTGRKPDFLGREYNISILEEAIFTLDDPALAETLLQHGAQADAVCAYYDCEHHRKANSYLYDAAKFTILHAATKNGKHRFIPLLLKYGARIDATLMADLFINSGDTLPDREVVQSLVDCGGDLNCKVPTTITGNVIDNYSISMVSMGKLSIQVPLLYYLVQHQYPVSLIQMMLELGADANGKALCQLKSVDSCLTIADCCIRENKDPRILELLLEHGADPNAPSTIPDESGQACSIPPIFRAMEFQMHEMVPPLLKHGADPNARFRQHDRHGLLEYTVVIHCINYFYGEHFVNSPLKLLLEHGADPNAAETYQLYKGHYQQTPPLSYAAIHNRLDCVPTLLAYGADPNVRSVRRDGDRDNGHFPLIDAIAEKNAGMVKLLLEHGADPNTQRIEYGTSDVYIGNALLYSAMFSDREEMVRLLLEFGADTSVLHVTEYNDGSVKKESVLHYAVHYAGSMSMVRMLVDHGCSLDLVTTFHGLELPFRKFPYEMNDEWTAFMRQIGWTGPNFFDRLKLKKLM